MSSFTLWNCTWEYPHKYFMLKGHKAMWLMLISSNLMLLLFHQKLQSLLYVLSVLEEKVSWYETRWLTQQWHLTGFIYSLSCLFTRNDSNAFLYPPLMNHSFIHQQTFLTSHFEALIVQPIWCLNFQDKKANSGFKPFTFSQYLFLSLSYKNIIRLLFPIWISPPVGILFSVAEANFGLLVYT